MKRYDCIQFADVCEMRESEDGDYILHTDHAEAMAGKDVEIAMLRGALKTIADFIEEGGNGYEVTCERVARAALTKRQDTPNAHA